MAPLRGPGPVSSSPQQGQEAEPWLTMSSSTRHAPKPIPLPLDKIDVGLQERFTFRHPHLAILRAPAAEDPVHFTAESEFGPYWSVLTTTTTS